ncbi:hypothetical protein BDZ45DRAFT_744445 [Acephala macrosclerotiorum]|nr:hypothetical protein BDZ45DRAFT_744445 [Acephala macrosclerotiorum]
MRDAAAVNGLTKDGGYAEYRILRDNASVRVPSHVDATKYAPIFCASVTCFNSMRNMNIPPESTVAILGLGGLGRLAIQ